jgi:hemoglobin-like flavoprotein
MQDVIASFGRCCIQPDFFDRFYEIFVDSHPGIAPMFAETNMKRQKELLRHGITTALMMISGKSKSAEQTLLRIARSHGPEGSVHVGADLYPFWRDSLIACVREFDEEFTPELEREWREAVNRVIQFILEHSTDAANG